MPVCSLIINFQGGVESSFKKGEIKISLKEQLKLDFAVLVLVVV